MGSHACDVVLEQRSTTVVKLFSDFVLGNVEV